MNAQRLLTFAVLLICLNSRGPAQTPVGPGLAVGQKAPTFALKDQNGTSVSLESLLKQGKVALVFYRSADW